jgi:hypothetical protein
MNKSSRMVGMGLSSSYIVLVHYSCFVIVCATFSTSTGGSTIHYVIYIYVLPTGKPFMGVGTGVGFLIPIEKPVPF